jgi:hypothetical protein
VIAEGTYAAVVSPIQTSSGPVSCQFGESGTKHTPMVLVRFEILRGPQAGQTIGWYGYFPETNEEVGERTIRSLRACGFRADTFAAMPAEQVAQECQIVVEHEEYEGKRRAKVQWVNAVAAGLKVESQMDPSKLRLFSARFEKTLKRIGPMGGPEARRETAPVNRESTSGPQADGDPGPQDDGARDTRVGYGDDEIPL